MKTKTALLFSIILLVTIGFTPVKAVSQEKQELVAQLVHKMGYGGAIHHFKNYVLRGQEKYNKNAQQAFTDVLAILSLLQSSGQLSTEEMSAINNIKSVANDYKNALVTVSNIRNKEKSLFKILSATDQQIKIDDSKAIAAIDLLRAPYQWDSIYEIDYQLGYGKAIHNFKNYLLRRQDKYHQRAEQQFSMALNFIAQLQDNEGSTSQYKNAVNNLQRTIRQYHLSLPVVKKTLAPALKSTSSTLINIAIRGADKAVSINDSPAVSAIAILKQS